MIKKAHVVLMLFVAALVGIVSATLVAQPARAVLNANTDDFVVTYTANASGVLPSIVTTGVGNNSGGIAVSGNLNLDYSWHLEGTTPTAFTPITDAVTRGTTDATNSLSYIPIPSANPSTSSSWGANARVNLTIRKKDPLTSKMYGFHGWLPNMETQNSGTLLSATVIPDIRASMNDMVAEIKSFGTFSNLTSLRWAFMDAPASFVVSTALPSTVTDLKFTFRESLYNSPEINQWNVSNVASFFGMFLGSSFNQSLGLWTTTSAVDMSYMFSGNSSFNQPLNSFDVSKVTDFTSMFRSATAFNQPLNNWITSSAIKMAYMFAGASSFNQELNSWDVSKVTDFTAMFFRNSAPSAMTFNKPLNLWNTGAGTNFGSMFSDNSAFNQDISSWNMSKATTLNLMFAGATSAFNNGETYVATSPGTHPLSWSLGAVTTMTGMFQSNTRFNQSLDGWNISKATGLGTIFYGATAFNNGYAKGVSGVLDWDLGTYLANRQMSQMFQGATSFNQDIHGWSTWGVSNIDLLIPAGPGAMFDHPVGNIELTTASAGSTIPVFFGGAMSQSNFDETIVEWSYRQAPASSTGVYIEGTGSALKKFSTCLTSASSTQLTSTGKFRFIGFQTGVIPGTCVDRSVTWAETSPYSNPRVVTAGVYSATPISTATSSGALKYMVYSRAQTSDCKVNADTGVVTYKVLGVSCTVKAYSVAPDATALSAVTKTFTTQAPATYTVTYNYNSATGGNSTATTTWTTGDTAITLPTPTRTGYDFAGWYTEAGLTNATGLTYSPTSNITLYARFTSTVVYDSQGGSSVPSVVVNAGSLTTLNSALTKPGYNFSGWYTDTNYTTRVPSAGYDYTPLGNVTIYAKWTAKTLSVTYSVNGGSAVTGTTTTTGGTVSEPTATTKAGYTFAGWYTDSGLTTAVTSWPYTHGQTANFSLYAAWTANTLTINYQSNGGSAISNGTTLTGGTISAAPTDPTRTGYTFAGWFSNAGLSAAVSWPYTHGQTANFTLYAKWTANTLVVTYDSNGGSSVTDGSTTTGGTISSAPTDPTRTGYNFSGWYTDSGLSSAANWPLTHGQTSDFTLYAKWISRAQASLNWNLSSTSVPYLGSLTLGTTGGSGTGSVSYSVSVNSTCTISGATLTPGQAGSLCLVTATKAGDASYDAASTAQQTISVTKINQATLNWNLASTSVPYLGSLTLGTTGGSGNGAVIYTLSGASACTISGSTLLPSDVGTTCEVTATKLTDGNYNSADTITQTITVTKISQAPVSFSNATSLTYGQTMDLLAVGGTGTGAMGYTVTSPGTTGCSISGVRLSVTGAGTCTVSATRASSTNYNASTAASLTITVSKASQSVSFTSTVPAEPIAGDTYNVTAATTSGLTPVVSVSSGTCTISGGVVTFGAGTCVIQAASSSTNQYLAASSVTQTIAVGQRNQTLNFAVNIASLTTKTYGDPAFYAQATSTEATLSPTFATGSGTTNSACAVSSTGVVVIVAVGTCELEASQAGTADVAAASTIRKSFTVVPDQANAPFVTSVSAGHETITAAFIKPTYIGGSAITGYQIVAVAGGTTVVNSACSVNGSGTTETCSVNGLNNGTSYRIKVAAITAAGIGVYSDLSASRVPATNPAAVSAFTAVPNNTVIDLTWQDPVSLGGGTFDSYRIFFKKTSDASYPNTYITVQSQTPRSYQITGLINGEAYDVKIVTVTTANTQSLVSNTAEVKETPRTVPEPPATIEVIEVAGDLVITWSTPLSDGGNAISEYRVTINGTVCTMTNALDTVCIVPAPTSGGSYPIEVKAKNDAGLSSPAMATFTKAGVPSSGGGGTESAPSADKAIEVLALSVKNVASSGGQLVTVTGKNFKDVTTILVGDVKARVIQVSDTVIKFVAPGNLKGKASLEIKSPVATVKDAFSYYKGVAKASVRWILGYVQANTTLKASDRLKLKRGLEANPAAIAVTCVGYQSYAYNTPLDALTAIGRAKQACAYLKSLNPKLTVKSVIARTNLTGTPSRKLAVQFRAIK